MEQVLRLGIDSTGMVSGAQRANRALDSVAQRATTTATAVDRIERSFRIVQRALGGIAAAAAIRSIVQVGAEFDSLRRSLDAVAGGSAEAREQLVRLREVAKLPGLGLEEAIQASVRLQAVGFSAEFAERSLKAFGNAVATTGGAAAELDRVIFQLGQMAAKGKIAANDLRPIIETAPAVAKVLRDEFGTVDAEALQNLGLTTEQFLDRLVGALERLPKVTGGIRTQLENAGDAINQALDKLAQGITPEIEGVTGAVERMGLAVAEVDVEDLRAGIDAVTDAAALGATIIGVRFVAGLTAAAVAKAQAAAASIAAARAQQQQTAAAVQGAIAELQMARALGAGTAARVAQRNALANLTAAQAAHTAAVAAGSVAQRAATAAMGAFTAAARFLLTNPIGIAITLAATAWTIFRTRTDEATESLDRHAERVAELTEQYGEMTRQQLEAHRASVMLLQDMQAQELAELERERRRRATPDLSGPTGTSQFGDAGRIVAATRAAAESAAELDERIQRLRDSMATNRAEIEASEKALEALANRERREARAATEEVTKARQRLLEVLRQTKRELELQRDEQRAVARAERLSEDAVAAVRREYERRRAHLDISERFKDATEAERAELRALVDEYFDLLDAQDRRKKQLAELEQLERRLMQLRAQGELLATGRERGPGGRAVEAGEALVRAARPTDPAAARARAERLRDAAREAAAMEAIYEEAARGIQRSLSTGFASVFRDGTAGFQQFAETIVDTMVAAAAEIAAAFVAERLGLDKLLADIEAGRKPQLSGAAGAAVKYGGGAAIGALAGYQSGSPLGGAVAGALSGAALGGPVGAALGALGGLAGGIAGFGKRAREEAERMALARAAWERELEDFSRLFTEPTLLEDAQRDLERRFQDLAVAAIKASGGTFTGDPTELSVERVEAIIPALRALVERTPAGGEALRKMAEDLEKLTAAMRENQQRLQEQLERERAAFERDLQLRRLVAEGKDEEAAALREQIQLEALLKEARRLGVDEGIVRATLAEERLAEERRKAAEAAAELRRKENERLSFEADLAARVAALRGDTLAEIEARERERARQELARAEELAEQGTISREAVERLAEVLEGELAKALQAAADAAAQIARALEQDLAVRRLVAEGRNTEAEALRLQLQHQEELRRYIDAGVTAELLDELRAVQQLERDALQAAQQQRARGSSAVARPTLETEAVTNARSISSGQAVKLLDHAATANVWLAQIASNTAAAVGRQPSGRGVGAVPVPSMASRPMVQLNVHFHGPVSAEGLSAGGKLSRQLVRAMNEALGQAAQEEARYTGSGARR